MEWISNADNIRHAFEHGCFQFTERQKQHAREVQKEYAKRKRLVVAMIEQNTQEIICVFRSISDAERITGINNSRITAACKGRTKTAGGYKWEYMGDL